MVAKWTRDGWHAELVPTATVLANEYPVSVISTTEVKQKTVKRRLKYINVPPCKLLVSDVESDG